MDSEKPLATSAGQLPRLMKSHATCGAILADLDEQAELGGLAATDCTLMMAATDLSKSLEALLTFIKVSGKRPSS
ncbi:MAG TPA: hypothetical protein VG651_05905 [Stellaceae bacterium]|nr:hypothetical protein [Stellaceae bacterium]